MKDIKVVIADDSGVMRILIKNILDEIEGVEVVGVAANGKDLFHEVEQLSPDVVLTDLYMGEHDGIYAIQKIMKFKPTPIIILSSAGNSDFDLILEALKEGAVDYINKPVKNTSRLKELSTELKEKIHAVHHDRAKIVREELQKKYNTNPHTFGSELPYEVILIGSSTGGPTALEHILGNIPNNLPVPMVIVQHMPENFIPSFVQRLKNVSGRGVTISTAGTELKKGEIYIVEGGRNTVMMNQNGTVSFQLTNKEYKAYNNPSIDALFLSAAEIYGSKILSVILSGMGSDGVEGITKIKSLGGATVAQTEESCVVYGMPKRANQAGAINYNIHLKDIAPFLMSALS